MSNEPNNPEFPSFENNESDTGFGPTGPAVGTLPPPPAPARPAHRRNRAALFLGVIAAVLLSLLIALVGVLAMGIAAVAAIASGDFEINTETVEVEITPTALSELPASISEEKADIEIDLTEVDPAEWAGEEPFELDVRADYGSIKVIVPDDVTVSVDASSDLGEVKVFGQSSNGFSNDILSHSNAVGSDGSDNAKTDLELDLDLDIGAIKVVRG